MTTPRNVRLTRREMLRKTMACAAGSVAAPLVIRGSALGADGATAASERITVGTIGVGCMGRGHTRNLARYPDAQVVAISDVDPWRRDNMTAVLKDIYGKKSPSGQFDGFKAYGDFRDLLARTDIDAVCIVTGERWHPAITVLAAEAGKDIYCEKPISLTIRQARTMAESVRRHNRVFQTGLQQRSSREFCKAAEMVHAGLIGEVKTAYVSGTGVSQFLNLPAEPLPKGLDWEMWLGPCPWHPYNYRYHHTGAPQHVVPWCGNRAFGGGGLTAGTIHNLDSAHAGLQKDGQGPVEITPPGVNGESRLTYKYADGTRIICSTRLVPGKHPIPEGWNPQTAIEKFGVLYVGDRGWVHVERGGFLKCYPEHLLDVKYSKAHTISSHYRDWIDCIHTRRRPRVDVEIGANSTILAHLGCIAFWTGRHLRWDPVKEEFIGDSQANAMRSRATREPWSV